MRENVLKQMLLNTVSKKYHSGVSPKQEAGTRNKRYGKCTGSGKCPPL